MGGKKIKSSPQETIGLIKIYFFTTLGWHLLTPTLTIRLLDPNNNHRTGPKLIQYDKQQNLFIAMPLPSAHLSTVTTSEQDKYSSWGDGGAQVPLVLAKRLLPMAFQFAGNVLCGVVAGLQKKKKFIYNFGASVFKSQLAPTW